MDQGRLIFCTRGDRRFLNINSSQSGMGGLLSLPFAGSAELPRLDFAQPCRVVPRVGGWQKCGSYPCWFAAAAVVVCGLRMRDGMAERGADGHSLQKMDKKGTLPGECLAPRLDARHAR